MEGDLGIEPRTFGSGDLRESLRVRLELEVGNRVGNYKRGKKKGTHDLP